MCLSLAKQRSPFLRTLRVQPPQEPGASLRLGVGGRVSGGSEGWERKKDPSFYNLGFVFVELESPNKRP